MNNFFQLERFRGIWPRHIHLRDYDTIEWNTEILKKLKKHYLVLVVGESV